MGYPYPSLAGCIFKRMQVAGPALPKILEHHDVAGFLVFLCI